MRSREGREKVFSYSLVIDGRTKAKFPPIHHVAVLWACLQKGICHPFYPNRAPAMMGDIKLFPAFDP